MGAELIAAEREVVVNDVRYVRETTLFAAVERAESLAETLHTILDPSYVGNYDAAEVVEIYRKWAKTALERDDSRSALSQPVEAV